MWTSEWMTIHKISGRSNRILHSRATWAHRILRTEGQKVAEAVAQVVREKHTTQVVFGRSAQTGWRRYLYSVGDPQVSARCTSS